MKLIFIILFIILLLFLQIGIFPHISIFGVFPNLILLSILGLSILQGWKKTLPWTIAGGLFLDFYSLTGVLGLSVVGLLIVSYLAYSLSQNIFKKANLFSLALNFLIAIFVYSLCLLILFSVFSVISDFRFLTFIVAIIYNLVLSLPIFYGLKKIQSKT